MAINDVVFKVVSTDDTVYDPVKLTTSTTTTLSVTNYGVEALSGLGMYVTAATSLGDVDNPADFPPHTDFQDLLTWGQAVVSGLESVGGLKLTLPQNDLTNTVSYVAREQGSKRSNKLTFKDLAAGETAEFVLEIETPPAVASRRAFVNLVLE